MKAREKGVLLTPVFFRFEHKGDHVVGRYISATDIESTKGGKTYKQYVFEVTEGRIKFSLGSVTDSSVFPSMQIGGIYEVTSNGKLDLQGGRSVNDFEVLFWGFSGNTREEGQEM